MKMICPHFKLIISAHQIRFLSSRFINKKSTQRMNGAFFTLQQQITISTSPIQRETIIFIV